MHLAFHWWRGPRDRTGTSRCSRSRELLPMWFSVQTARVFNKMRGPGIIKSHSASPVWSPIKLSDYNPLLEIATKHYDGWVATSLNDIVKFATMIVKPGRPSTKWLHSQTSGWTNRSGIALLASLKMIRTVLVVPIIVSRMPERPL